MKLSYVAFLILLTMLLMTGGCSPLNTAARNGDSLAVEKLINGGADINERDNKGNTPLIHAAGDGKTETVKILLNRGADINIQNKKGYTALAYAIDYEYTEISRLLIEKGAKIELKDNAGYTALMHATAPKNLKIMKMLLERGADRNARDIYGRPALLIALAYNHASAVTVLVENGADIDAQDETGKTALHYLARTYNSNDALLMTDYLLSRNANPFLKDAEGWTAVRYAIFNRNTDIAALLRKKTDWQEDIEALTMDEALRSPSSYKPDQDMFDVPAEKERAYRIATTDCNLIVIPYKTGLVIATSGAGYPVGMAIDAMTIKNKFQKCMAKMGFRCVKNCSN